MYTYIESGPGLYTVGQIDPTGRWTPDTDHDTRRMAAKRAHYLNRSAKIENNRIIGNTVITYCRICGADVLAGMGGRCINKECSNGKNS